MTHRALSELERSKLLNELELLPEPSKRRIVSATNSGRVLDDSHERDMQRARVAQMPWGRALAALSFTMMALMRCSDLVGGRRSWQDWLVAVFFITNAAYWARRWWLMRRLGQRLDHADAPRGPQPTGDDGHA